MDILWHLLEYGRLELWGHEIFPGGTFLNVILALIVPLWVWLYKLTQRSGDKTLEIMSGIFLIVYLPNTLYLVFELRHVLTVDGIAEPFSVSAWIFFGLFGILGAYLTVSSILQISTNFGRNKKNPAGTIVALSMLSGFGATLGLFDINSFTWIIFPIETIKHSISIVTTPELSALVLISGAVLSITCMVPVLYKRYISRRRKFASIL